MPLRFALLPLMIAGCYMTRDQAIVVNGLDFYLVRVLILLGLLRIVVRREIFAIKPNGIDRVLAGWLLVATFLYILFDGANVTLTQRLGYAYDVAGTYMIVRASLKTIEDVVRAVKMLAVVVVPLGVLFAIEAATGRNAFSVLGGVPLLSEIRDGRVRCQGPFLHSILAGTFGATALPLFVGLWAHSKKGRLLAASAILATTVIVVTSGSSGPLMAVVAGCAGLFCWKLRHHTRAMRWGMGMALVALAAVMKEPVWFLIARVSDISGGGGWYRSALIDAAVRHFDEWWLIGTGYTAHWMATGITADANSADIVNEFVAQGVHGGLLALFLFIWLIVRCFKAVGPIALNEAERTFETRFFAWSIGCALLAHVASFFSVSYFDQMVTFWGVLLGMIATLSIQAAPAATEAPAASSAAAAETARRTSGRSAFGRAQSGAQRNR